MFIFKSYTQQHTVYIHTQENAHTYTIIDRSNFQILMSYTGYIVSYKEDNLCETGVCACACMSRAYDQFCT